MNLPLSVANRRHNRLAHIGHARQTLIYGAAPGTATPLVESWIEKSWLRCLAQGRRPEETPSFDQVPPGTLRLTLDANRHLLQAARPIIEALSLAIADTRYFSILTDQHGVVIDVNGPVDRHDRRCGLITCLGTDLSELQVGTTAIGAALASGAPVWLHRGEHFFDATSIYSCAGAPIFGPDGRCIGMLDLTGIEAAEQPELRHLVTQAARSIENALVLAGPHALLVRLNWPGRPLGGETDGLLCLDAEGHITGANQTARELLPQMASSTAELHCDDLFALPYARFFDMARRHEALNVQMDAPLCTGLRLQAMPLLAGHRSASSSFALGGLPHGTAPTARPLRDLETALIRKAVTDARGNVLQAAKALGISRATVYRRLSPATRR